MTALQPNFKNDLWKSTYYNDYKGARPVPARPEPFVPKLRDIEPVLMPRPVVFKSQNPAGKPTGRFDDPNWGTVYRNSYRSHHMNRYETDQKPVTARDVIQRPVFLPPLHSFMAPYGALTDRPAYYSAYFNPYSHSAVQPNPNSAWKSTYKDSYRGYIEDPIQPLVYYQPSNYTWPYYQHPIAPTPLVNVGAPSQESRFNRVDQRDYLGDVEAIQEPPRLPQIPTRLVSYPYVYY